MATVPSLTRLCTLGRGATATVSLVCDIDTSRLFAIKSAENSIASPLQHEYRILSSLSSPHIISCHGSYTSNSHFHLLLEFAPGGSLFDCINNHTEGHLEESDIRSYARDILHGLSYLHSNSILHGDIKSQNVLISSDRRAKIADFGAAMQIGDKQGPLSGTPAFMAPEVARGEKRGPAADIWALGCTVIEMATGKAPWHGIIKDQDVLAAVYQIGFCSDSVPPIPDWISEEGKDFLVNCLKWDPNDRWSAEKLLNHPFVHLRDERMERIPTFSPQSALDFGLAFDDSEDEAGEEDTSSNASERIRELAGFGFRSSVVNWDPNEEGWIEVRNSKVEENGEANEECENRDQVEFLDYGDDSDLVLSNLNLNIIGVLERTCEEGDCSLQSNCDFDFDFHVCKVNSINKAVNFSVDQIMSQLSVSFFLKLASFFCTKNVEESFVIAFNLFSCC